MRRFRAGRGPCSAGTKRSGLCWSRSVWSRFLLKNGLANRCSFGTWTRLSTGFPHGSVRRQGAFAKADARFGRDFPPPEELDLPNRRAPAAMILLVPYNRFGGRRSAHSAGDEGSLGQAVLFVSGSIRRLVERPLGALCAGRGLCAVEMAFEGGKSNPMEEPFAVFAEEGAGQECGGQPAAHHELVERTSAEYLGQWNRLVSTTNWQKGRIICQWRAELIAAGAPADAWSDEAWSRRVGNISPQHVGRLRRVFQRFGEVYEQYPGLYWSHFLAALDWPDAEMWLEGAVHSHWSVPQMRLQRWEALGSVPDRKPRDEEIVSAEWDEDVDAADQSPQDKLIAAVQEVHDPRTTQSAQAEAMASREEMLPPCETIGALDAILPPDRLPLLPTDLAEAFERFRMAILNHRMAGWQEVSPAEVLTLLDALRELTTAPL